MAAPTFPSPALAWAGLRTRIHPRVKAWRRSVHQFTRSPLAVVGAVLVIFYLGVALLAPWIAPPEAAQSDPYEMRLHFADDFTPPGGDYLFGTGESGVDIFYGVVWGARISMGMGIGVTLAGAAAGTLLGALAGYFGGWLDEMVMRVTDVFLSLPQLIIAMSVSVALGPGLRNIALALVIVWWPAYARLVRSQVIAVREAPYVEAARAVGAGNGRIILRHVLPNSLSPVLVQATMDVGTVVLVSASLSFVGFGPSGTNFAEWGTLVNTGQQYMMRAPWAVTIPGVAIFGFALAFNLLGDGLRDLLDPRTM